jgi:uncharacterized damage-inducible protein DinB
LHRALFPTFTIALSFVASSATAQGPGTAVPITAPLEKQFAGDLTVLHDKVVALAQAIPAEKYSWRPAAEVRTISQVLMHVVGEWFYMCPLSVAAKPPSDFGAPNEKMRALEQIVEKTEVVAQLEKSWAHCRAALASIDPARLVPEFLPARMGFPRVVLLISGDQHEHLGQLIAYARSIGVAPPWSK